MRVERTDSQNKDFQKLVSFLDAELAIRDGEEHAFYHQFNGIESLTHCVVCYSDDIPVGCGAFKPYEYSKVEIKRMFTKSDFRGKGIAKNILKSLETWARELGYEQAVLETGIRQPEAISLYTSVGFERIPNYGQYKGLESSLCFEKDLK